MLNKNASLKIFAGLLIVFAFSVISCGPFADKKDLREDNSLGPDSIGTPGFVPDTTIRKDSNSEKFRYLDSLWKVTEPKD